MELWSAIFGKGLTPIRLWLKLDPETRMEAATALYRHDWEDDPVKLEADLAIAAALRFRPVAVKKMPEAERIKTLARVVRPEQSLISSLLLALHLEGRTDMMATFLDSLEIPHEGGLIDAEFECEPPSDEKIKPAIEALFAKYPGPQVELYLVTIYMMDQQTWQNVGTVMKERVEASTAS
ncbi:MAG: hypothetical protein R3E12_04830 [Candidatus Eisenbacteria bacterium]|uniref:Uncharacterized protein n=1 Tax=Eiseniibacteriota bacterium TaxID=2212470 RepID=A0A956RN04_UNCEI|nr:hypothetical protein [Candidatus Eisenbacteria bacterium]